MTGNRRAAALAGLVALVVACAAPAEPMGSPAGSASRSAVPATQSPRPTPTATPTGTRADELAFLVESLVRSHPDPFLGGTRAAFEERVAALAARAGSLTFDEYLVEVMRLLGDRDRDGHTGIIPFAQGETGLDAWPLALYAFEEGIFVVGALAPHDQLVGMRVVRIAGRPVDEIVELVTPLVAHDNPATISARLPGYLVVPAVLRGLGLLGDGVSGLTLEAADGSTLDVTPDPIPMAEFREWRGLFDPLVPPSLPADDDGPLSLRNRGERFWAEPVGDALFVGYNQVLASTDSGQSMTDLAATIAAAFADGSVERVVVDVRHNSGGENGTSAPLRDVLLEQASRDPGSVAVLIGRSTFSAAGNFITELRSEPGVRFVGEPSGGAPNQFGDPAIYELPASGMWLHVATRDWEFAPGDDSLAIEPDVTVPVRWSDYAAGIDAALEAALH